MATKKEDKYKERIQQIRQTRLANRAKREKDIENRIGKKLMWNETQIVDYLAADKVPTQMQHCILKVREKIPGTEHKKFISAFNICGAVFTRNGYQQPLSMTLTSKGLKNNMMHRREVAAGEKRGRYVSLVDRLYGAAIEDSKQEKEEKAQSEYQKWKKEKEASNKPKPGLQSTVKATTSSRMKRDQ